MNTESVCETYVFPGDYEPVPGAKEVKGEMPMQRIAGLTITEPSK